MARRLVLAVALCVAGAMTAVTTARQPAVPSPAEREYLVQFRGPIQESWKTAVTSAGARLLDYQPPFAFRARLRPSDIPALNALAFVSAVSPYQTDAKIARARGGSGDQLFVVRVESDHDPAAVATTLATLGFRVSRAGSSLLMVAAPFDQLRAVAALPGVAGLEPYALRIKHNEFGGGVIMGSRIANGNGYDGSTQVIGIADTGLGGGTSATAHPEIQPSRIRALYNRPGAPSACFDSILDDGLADVDSGHGTHVATAALGSGGALGVGRGTAPGATLVFQAIENYAIPSLLCSLLYGISDGYYLVGLPTDLGELYQQAFDAGVRIHSDSWGSAVNGAYTADAESTDAFVWAHRDMALLFSAGNEGVDADEDGRVDAESIGSPATAKNVIAVGASENDRRGDWRCDQGLVYSTCAAQGGQNSLFSYGDTWPERFAANPLRDDVSAGNAEQMAAFSSRGPTADGRIKPDVVAPGTWTLSGYSELYQQQYDAAPNPRTGVYQYDGWGIPADAGHKYLGGTSMAAPLAAGAAAVVRDFYLKARGHQASAALVKATLINTAVDLLDENNDGALDNAFPIPNIHEGWGRVDLQNATDNTQQFSDETAPLTTGATATFTFNVTEPNLPFKATLVWSDYPASPSAATSLVNDLDLRLVGPDGTTYLGNVFAGGWSASGGAPDRVNNVENAFVPSAAPGTWTVVVSAYNVPMGPQTFALVVDNAPAGSGLPTVRVSVDDGSAAEAGLSAAAVRLTRTGDLSDPLTVTYSIGGTATTGTDFVTMPGVATFAAGEADAIVPVVPLDDVAVEPNETVVISLSDGAGYVVGSPSSGTVTIASDDVPPDLIVTTLAAPTAAAAGAIISLSDTTRNQGTVPAPASSTGFYLSLNTAIDAGDTFLGSRSVGSLAAGGAESGTVSVTIPATMAPGTYYIVAGADWSRLVEESSETNNLRASSAVKLGPDLVISAVTVPATAAPGGTVLVADTTRNQGAGSAAATSTALYLSTNSLWDAADALLGAHAVAALAGGASVATSTEVTIPGGIMPGTYYIVARADLGEAVPETLENNNTRAAAVSIGADLVVSSVAVPSAGGAGGNITVVESTRNSGGAESTESTTEFYLSANGSLDVSDVRLGARNVPTLAAGATSSTSVTLVIPSATPPGSYYLIAKADALLEVREISETNNTKASGAIKVGPDLVVATLTVPGTAEAGATISVNDTVQNQGGASSGGTDAVFYLSTNTSLAAGDIELGRRTVPALGVSASDAATVSLALPSNLAAGSYYIVEMVDVALSVTESTETNNTRASAAIKIGPDLSVTSLSGPASVVRGGTVTITDTTKNQGGGAAPASTTRFYLSTNSSWDAADVPLGARAVALLPAGAQSQASTAFVVPAGTAAGTYYVIARCDDASVVGEIAENNNIRSTPLRVNP